MTGFLVDVCVSYTLRHMCRRVLLARLTLSAIMASGCSPERDTEPHCAHPPPISSISALRAPAHPSTTFEDQVDPPDPSPRLYALNRHVWVRSRPSDKAPWLGFMGLGGAVPLRDEEPVRGPGCAAFLPIAPRGYVCLDDRATLDPNAPTLRAIQAIAPRLDTPWPHDYAESRQTPRYKSLPSHELQQRREFQLDQHLETVAALRRGDFEGDIPTLLRDVDVSLSNHTIPDFLSQMPSVHEHVTTVKAGSTLSYAYEFDTDERTWLVTGDGVLIPKDRVAPYEKSTFQGLVIDRENPLPVGFVRERPQPQFIRQPDGTIVPRGASWPRLASFGLTGTRLEQDGTTYLETRDGLWADRDNVTEVKASPVTPWGDELEGAGLAEGMRWPTGGSVPPPGPRRTWVEVSVHVGWLVAYEGTRPVLATLVATGRGEPVEPGSKSLQTSTPPGVFAIQGKYWTSTMAVNSTAHFDVPFAMPYFGAYALHAAYWHDRWGEKVSLGCVNLAPIDARWLFLWTEPNIPEGWHGVRATSETGNATVVVIHA